MPSDLHAHHIRVPSRLCLIDRSSAATSPVLSSTARSAGTQRRHVSSILCVSPGSLRSTACSISFDAQMVRCLSSRFLRFIDRRNRTISSSSLHNPLSALAPRLSFTSTVLSFSFRATQHGSRTELPTLIGTSEYLVNAFVSYLIRRPSPSDVQAASTDVRLPFGVPFMDCRGGPIAVIDMNTLP